MRIQSQPFASLMVRSNINRNSFIYRSFMIQSRITFPLSLDLVSQLGDSVKEIGHKTNVSNLKDGSIGVLVDGGNHLGVLHSSQMLDGAGNADGNVKLGSNHLSGLANLQRVVGKARVHGGSRGSDGGSKSVGQREHDLVKVLLVLETSASRDHLLGASQIGSLGLGELLGQPLGLGGGGGVLGVGHRGGSSLELGGGEGRGSHGQQLDGVVGLDGLNGVSGVDGSHKGVLGLNLGHVGDLGGVQQSRDSGEHVLAKGRRGSHDMGEATLLGGGRNQIGVVLGQTVVVGRRGGGEHGSNALDLGDLGSHVSSLGAGHQSSHVSSQLLGGGQSVEGGSRNHSVVLLNQSQCAERVLSQGGGGGDKAPGNVGSDLVSQSKHCVCVVRERKEVTRRGVCVLEVELFRVN